MKTCRRNPQLPPHKHRRENGMLKCDGYPPRGGWKISKGYLDPATRKRMNYSMSAVSRAGFMKKNHPKLDGFNGIIPQKSEAKQ